MDVAIARGSRLSPSAWPSQTFEMTLPVLLPATLELLRQQATLYGSQNRDPAHDCLGLCITAGKQHHCTFLPFGGQATRRMKTPSAPKL